MLKDMVDCVKSFNKPVDAMIGRDHNQEMASTEVQQFFNELQMKDVDQTTDGIELKEVDDTNSRGGNASTQLQQLLMWETTLKDAVFMKQIKSLALITVRMW